ncbi:MAG: hypothetical protein Q7I92_11815 [Humidesulfovibrio sp.]|nr:hypothetical protein [Humidesulfovibrio sp.]
MVKQPTVLVDNCVLSTGYADPAQWKRIEAKVGHIKLGNPLQVYQVKHMNSDQRRVMTAIQAISNYAEQEHILLYTYDELRWERWQGYHSMRNNLTPLAAFQHIQFSEVPSPIERTKFFQTANWLSGEEVEKFIGWLLKVDVEKMCKVMNKDQSFSDFERLCASKLGAFRTMCSESVFGRKRARDAYHYWAAECSNLEYFLTVDTKFINAYKNAIKDNKLSTECKIISPTEFVEELKIPNSPISIPTCGKMFSFNGHEYKK